MPAISSILMPLIYPLPRGIPLRGEVMIESILGIELYQSCKNGASETASRWSDEGRTNGVCTKSFTGVGPKADVAQPGRISGEAGVTFDDAAVASTKALEARLLPVFPLKDPTPRSGPI